MVCFSETTFSTSSTALQMFHSTRMLIYLLIYLGGFCELHQINLKCVFFFLFCFDFISLSLTLRFLCNLGEMSAVCV